MTYRYKLTDSRLRTHNGYQWCVGEWVETDGDGGLCGPGWLHCYDDPMLAVLHNPIHANIATPRMWRVEVDGNELRDRQMKAGWTRMRLVEELPLPVITTEQRVRYAIMCALEVHSDPSYVSWARAWLDGTDRSRAAAEAARAAAEAARAAARAAWAAARAARSARAAALTAAWAAALTAAWAAESDAALTAAWAAESDAAINLQAIARMAMEDA